MKLRAEPLVVVAGLMLLAVLAVARQQMDVGPPPSVFSTYDTGRNGYRALYRVLRSEGVHVVRFEHVTARLPASIRTFVISSYANNPSAVPLGRKDEPALRAFVVAGGRLVVLDAQFAGKRDVTPGVATSQPTRASGAQAAPLAGLRGVRRVDAPIRAAFRTLRKGDKALLLAGKRAVAVVYPLGKGDVVAITAPSLFANRYLAAADDAAFAYDVLAHRGTVAFDEYVHGYDSEASFWSVLPAPVRDAVWIVALIVGLGLIGANAPFAPALRAQRERERSSADYVSALATLMRKARAARAAIAVFAADARRSRLRFARAEALDELQALADCERPSDAAVLRAAYLDFRLRKERV